MKNKQRALVLAVLFIKPVNDLVFGDIIKWTLDSQALESTDGPDDFFALEHYARDIDITLLRYPGGSMADEFHWLNSIGDLDTERGNNSCFGAVQKVVIGTDEYLKFVNDIGAQAIIVVNFGTGTPEEAAAWVAYLNGEIGDRTAIGVDENGDDWHDVSYWAQERADNGHPAPYNVQYWEIGNEIDTVISQLNAIAPQKEIGIAITEYSSRPRTLDLAEVLYGAGLLNNFLREDRTAFVNYFRLFEKKNRHKMYVSPYAFPYYKSYGSVMMPNREGNRILRPTWYLYGLYSHIQGGEIIDNTVETPTFDSMDFNYARGVIPGRENVPYLDALSVISGDTLRLLVLNKHPRENIVTTGISTQLNISQTFSKNNMNRIRLPIPLSTTKV